MRKEKGKQIQIPLHWSVRVELGTTKSNNPYLSTLLEVGFQFVLNKKCNSPTFRCGLRVRNHDRNRATGSTLHLLLLLPPIPPKPAPKVPAWSVAESQVASSAPNGPTSWGVFFSVGGVTHTWISPGRDLEDLEDRAPGIVSS